MLAVYVFWCTYLITALLFIMDVGIYIFLHAIMRMCLRNSL